ncbi:hypothetical protein ACROYT_G011993 [Oculina patagonica]
MDLLTLRIEIHGFEKSYDPEGDGDCFYNAAAFQLGRDASDLKNEIFDYLAHNQYDETPDSYIKVIDPPEQDGTPHHELYFGHTGNHYFALREKYSPSLPGFDEKSKVWPQLFSTSLNFILPVEYLIGEMFWFQEINEAKQLDSYYHLLPVGSCAEGLCIPRSILHKSGNNFSDSLDSSDSDESFPMLAADLDIMSVKEPFEMNGNEKIPIFDIVQSGNDPRYVLLRYTEQWKKLHKPSENSDFVPHSFLLTTGIFENFIDPALAGLKTGKVKMIMDLLFDRLHGPARKLYFLYEAFVSLDKTVVFKYPNGWPESAKEWPRRLLKSDWPSSALVSDILQSGCHLAPVGRGKRENLANPELATCAQSPEVEGPIMDEHEWRISFSLAENKLGQSLSPVQRHIFVLLKIIKKAYLNDHDVISTYHLKNIFFWECENRENDFWREDNSCECLLSLLDRFVDCLKKRHLPHYIMPDSDLFMSADTVKLDEAAKIVLEVRENLFEKAVSFLTRLQPMMFQSREFANGFFDSKFQTKLITEEVTNELIDSLCQHYKEVIAGEHRNKNRNAMKGQQMKLIVDCMLCILDILDQFFSESAFSQTSLNSNISDPAFSSSLWSKYKDAFVIEVTKIESVFDVSQFTEQDFLFNVHWWYAMQEMLIVLREVYDSPCASKLVNFFTKILPLILQVTDEIRLFRVLNALVSVVENHNVKKVLDSIRDYWRQLGNIVKLSVCEISPLLLRVHESLLARSYCKQWFAKNGKQSAHIEDRERFTRLVREDIKSYPHALHLDEEFIKLSLMFFDEMIMGRDSCQIVPETTVMKQVKEIQQRIAHETVKAVKTTNFLAEKFLSDDFFSSLIEMINKLLTFES